jgi:hypothetical protein
VAEVLFVEYWNNGVRYILPQDPSLQAMIGSITNNVATTIPYGYQVYRSGRSIITEGIATGGSSTTLVDSDRTGSAQYAFDTGSAVKDDEGAALSAGDVVINVTDGSEATITAVTNASTLTFSSLSGGRRNNFEKGDYYRVVQKEANRPVMFINPPTTKGDETTAIEFDNASDGTYAIGNISGTEQKVAQSFKLTRDTVVRSVKLYLGKKTGTPLGNITVRIETNNGSVPSGTLANFYAKATLDENSIIESGWNHFVFNNPFRLSTNTTYWIVAEIPAQSNYYATPNNNYWTWAYNNGNGYENGTAALYNGTSWSAVSANDMLFTVNAAMSDESIYVHYAALPATMSSNSDILELPYRAEEVVLRYAIWLALRKRSTVGSIVDNAYQMYVLGLEDLKRWVHREGQQGYWAVRNVLPTAGRRLNVRQTADPAQFKFPRTFG